MLCCEVVSVLLMILYTQCQCPLCICVHYTLTIPPGIQSHTLFVVYVRMIADSWLLNNDSLQPRALLVNAFKPDEVRSLVKPDWYEVSGIFVIARWPPNSNSSAQTAFSKLGLSQVMRLTHCGTHWYQLLDGCRHSLLDMHAIYRIVTPTHRGHVYSQRTHPPTIANECTHSISGTSAHRHTHPL